VKHKFFIQVEDDELVADPFSASPEMLAKPAKRLATVINGCSTLYMKKKKKTTQGWVFCGVRRHAEPLGDNDPPRLYMKQ